MTLNEKSRESVSCATGMHFEDLADMDFEEIDKAISKKVGKKIEHMKPDDSILLCGRQVYFSLGRLLSLDVINKKLLKV